ncbi:hypothetical protein YC2023_070705 [Brassica napus]
MGAEVRKHTTCTFGQTGNPTYVLTYWPNNKYKIRPQRGSVTNLYPVREIIKLINEPRKGRISP